MATNDTEIERYSYDVVVIGAGGSGLRAAIEARARGLSTAIISKSLFGKAHTVMAEGGCAAAMGNANPNDNWRVHFRDTMRGGKFLNNWRMAELHAQEAPDRVWELEAWGFVSKLNTRHMLLAWLSLFGVALTDLYVWLLSSGAFTDPRFF